MTNCTTLIANFQADRICIETFGRDDQPVKCKKTTVPLQEENLYFPAMSASMQRKCRIKREQIDDCFMATGIYRLKKFYRKDLSKSLYVLFLITLSDTNGSRVVWRLYVK